jgi:hypothetical protein
MEIKFRHFQNDTDIALQEKFWLKVTKNLPWPWKPNKTQEIFSKKDSFDPRSKYFAFEGENLVGYQSIIVGREMIAFGYPWVLENHQNKFEIQNSLWNHTMEIINSDFPGKYLLQRVREQWTEQINFFLDKGFSLAQQYPIYFFHIASKKMSYLMIKIFI